MMDRSSPIYLTLVEQTKATIASQAQRVEMMESGLMRMHHNHVDITSEILAQLKEWQERSERLLADLEGGRI